MPKLLPELPQALKTRVKIIRADSKSAIRNWVCLVLGVILSGIPGTLSGSFPPPDTLHLFNGEDLSGWYTYLQESGKNNDPEKVFTVNNGILRISGEEWGCLTTLDSFENYRLIVEYRWGEETHKPRLDRARDSGILLHSRGEDGGSQGIWMHSIECQLIEGGTGDIIVVGDGTDRFRVTCRVSPDSTQGWYYDPDGITRTFHRGRVNWYGRDAGWEDRLGFRGKNDIEYPRDSWNRLECISEEDALKYYLNGQLVNQASEVHPSSGKIQIQSEGAEIFFRRIDIIPFQ